MNFALSPALAFSGKSFIPSIKSSIPPRTELVAKKLANLPELETAFTRFILSVALNICLLTGFCVNPITPPAALYGSNSTSLPKS